MKISGKLAVLFFVVAHLFFIAMLFYSANISVHTNSKLANQFAFYSVCAFFMGLIFSTVWSLRSGLAFFRRSRSGNKNSLLGDLPSNTIDSVSANSDGGPEASQSTGINNSDDTVHKAIKKIKESLDLTNLTLREKMYATLLMDNIESDFSKGEHKYEQLIAHVDALSEILKSSNFLAIDDTHSIEVLEKIVLQDVICVMPVNSNQ